ncbi:MAG: hypothetical protein U5L10_05040 [Candidatus Moranbacteria bacterium]|nr:hypothetical protein [Candidatus Moranbacteria bacterium]
MKWIPFVLSLAMTLGFASLGSADSQIEFDSKVEVRTTGKAYLESSSKGKDYYGEIRVLPEATVRSEKIPNLSLFLAGDFRLDNEGYASGVIDSFTEKERRWAANIREAHLEYFYKNFTLKVGKQIFDWSVTDTVSPLDNLAARDWNLIPDWERVGIPAFSARYDGWTWSVQTVAAPQFTPSKLPQGRWEEDLPAGLTGKEVVVDEDRFQYAVKVNKIWQGFDMTLAYYDGVSYNPHGQIDLGLTGPELKMRYSDQKVVSGALVKEVPWGIILKSEAGYYDQDKGDDFFQYVLGAQKEFYGIYWPTDSLVLLLQYTNEAVASQASDSVVEVTDFRRVFKNSFLWNLSYDPGGSCPWKLELEGSYNLSDSDSFWRPKVVYQKDNWQLEGGIQLTNGPEESFWGQYENDAMFLIFKYFF